jgi:hypothetical protein
MVLAITPRHKAVAVVGSGFVANMISLTMRGTPRCLQSLSGGTETSNYIIKGALTGPKTRIEQSFSMACEGTDRR